MVLLIPDIGTLIKKMRNFKRMSTLNVNRGEAELADSVGRSRLCRPKSEGKCKTINAKREIREPIYVK